MSLNNLRTAIGTSDSVILLASTCDFPQAGLAQIESEIIQYNHASDNSLSGVTRGVAGTSAASHSAGKSVTFVASFSPNVAITSTVSIISGSGAPTNGQTGVGVAGEGSLYINTSNGTCYINTGSISNPTWVLFQSGSDLGITQLTGDVTAGPGNGSQVATVVSTAAVKTLHADANPNLTGNVQLVSGTNISLSQVGNVITINVSGGSGANTSLSNLSSVAINTPLLNVNGVISAPAYAYTAEPNTGQYLSPGNGLRFAIQGVESLRLKQNQVQMAADGSNSVPSLAFASDSTTGWWFSSGIIHSGVATTEVLQITSSGLILIGTSTINMGANKISNMADPTLAQDAATKHYVDNSLPVQSATAQLLGTSGTVGPNTLYTPSVDGTFIFNFYGAVSAANNDTSIGINLNFTDTQGSRTEALTLLTVSTGYTNSSRNSIAIRAVAGQPITYDLFGNVDGTTVYDLFVTLTKVSN